MVSDRAADRTVRELFRQVARRSGVMAVVAIVVFGAVAVWTFRATPRFRSQALLRLESRSGSGSGLLEQMQNVPGCSLEGLGR